MAGAAGGPAARVARRGRPRRRPQELVALSRRSCSPARPARCQASLGPGGRRRGVPAPGRRLRRVASRSSRPTTSATSSASSSRWPSCSPTRSGVPVVKVGRIAGQFAKPRSSATETDRRRRAARRSAATSSTTPRFDAGRPGARPRAARAGVPPVGVDAEPAAGLHQGRLRRPHPGARVEPGVRRVQPGGPALRADRGRDRPGPALHAAPAASTSRPNPACTRSTSTPATRRCCSATRRRSPAGTRSPATGTTARRTCCGSASGPARLDGAHVEFLPRRRQPDRLQDRPDRSTPTRSLELCERLNPDRVPGRLTLITRMGADEVADDLPPLLRAVRDAGHPVVWACDPMHGNTFTRRAGRKTRHFDDILSEIAGFFRPTARGHLAGRHPRRADRRRRHRVPGRAPTHVSPTISTTRYETMCDPRLNARQGLDLAFRVAELIAGSPATDRGRLDGARPRRRCPGRSPAAAVVSTPTGSRRTAGDTDRPFRLASLSKPITAWATLVAVEEGTVASTTPSVSPDARCATSWPTPAGTPSKVPTRWPRPGATDLLQHRHRDGRRRTRPSGRDAVRRLPRRSRVPAARR